MKNIKFNITEKLTWAKVCEMALLPISRAANPFSLMKRLFLALDIAIVYKFNNFISISNLNALDTAFIDISTRIISLSFEACGIVEGSIVFGFCDGITTADDDIACDCDVVILVEFVTDRVPFLSSVNCDEIPGDKIGVWEAATFLNDAWADGIKIYDVTAEVDDLNNLEADADDHE